MSADRVHLPALDGFRGVSILLVVFYHMVHTPSFGWIGVQMLFVLSGFLITRNLLRDEHLPLATGLRLFYVRRALRIFPAMYLYLLLLLIASYLLEDFASVRPFLPWAAVYLQNIASIYGLDANMVGGSTMATVHLWSLSVEEHFYFLWPLLFLVTPSTHRTKLIWSMLLLAPVIRLLIQLFWTGGDGARPYPMAVYMFSGSHIDAFAIGALVALVPDAVSRRYASLRVFVGLFMLAVALGLLASGQTTLPESFKELRQHSLGYPIAMHASGSAIWGYSVVNVLCAFLVILAIHHPLVARCLRNSVLRWSGKISYSVYLVHHPILYLFNKHHEAFITALGSGAVAKGVYYLTYLGTTAVIASLSYVYFEKYFLRLKPMHRQTDKAPTIHADPALRAPQSNR